MTARKLGYRPSPPSEGLSAARRLGAGPVPEASNLRALTILENQDHQDCTANAIANAVRGAQIAAGAPASTPLPSRRAIYWLERAYLRETSQDAGAFIHLGFQALNAFGFCPEPSWPYDDVGDRWKRTPPLEVMQAAFDQRQPVDYQRIMSVGDDLVDDVKRALGAGHLVVYGVQVTEDFCSGNLGPTGVAQAPGPGDQIAGGHAMVFCGHSPDWAESLTSWGPDVFDGGYFKMSWDYVKQATDLWIVAGAPIYRPGAY